MASLQAWPSPCFLAEAGTAVTEPLPPSHAVERYSDPKIMGCKWISRRSASQAPPLPYLTVTLPLLEVEFNPFPDPILNFPGHPAQLCMRRRKINEKEVTRGLSGGRGGERRKGKVREREKSKKYGEDNGERHASRVGAY